MAHALTELETSVKLRPDNVDALNDLGAVLLRMGRAQDALQNFEKCQRLSPDFDRPFINSAIIYSNANQPAKARQVLEGFLARHPDNADVRSALDKLGTR
jgi:Flp pilus assembly protein TadD